MRIVNIAGGVVALADAQARWILAAFAGVVIYFAGEFVGRWIIRWHGLGSSDA